MKRRVKRATRHPVDQSAERYFVYRLYDHAGQLLYIGRSCTPLARLKQHHTTTAWAGDVVQIEGHGPYTWNEAVRRERHEILTRRPLHNIDGVTKKTGPVILATP